MPGMKGLKQEYWSGVTRGEVSVERRRMLSVECSRTVLKKETLAVSITVPIVACSKKRGHRLVPEEKVLLERKDTEAGGQPSKKVKEKRRKEPVALLKESFQLGCAPQDCAPRKSILRKLQNWDRITPSKSPKAHGTP